ncbi:MAG: hypothetical protein ACFFAQ_16550 [Promethearchaeota archaeon]
MIDDIIRLYKVGKELGLTRKEINKVLLFDKSTRPRVYNFLLLLVLFLFLIFSVFFVLTIRSYIDSNTYARGTLYSTIEGKDFHTGTKNRKISFFFKP